MELPVNQKFDALFSHLHHCSQLIASLVSMDDANINRPYGIVACGPAADALRAVAETTTPISQIDATFYVRSDIFSALSPRLEMIAYRGNPDRLCLRIVTLIDQIIYLFQDPGNWNTYNCIPIIHNGKCLHVGMSNVSAPYNVFA